MARAAAHSLASIRLPLCRHQPTYSPNCSTPMYFAPAQIARPAWLPYTILPVRSSIHAPTGNISSICSNKNNKHNKRERGGAAGGRAGRAAPGAARGGAGGAGGGEGQGH